MWPSEATPEKINQFCENTHISLLDLKVTELTEGSMLAEMPVDYRHVQPLRMLHGGVSVAVAESLGSIASNVLLQSEGKYAVGQSIQCHHFRPVKEGEKVFAECKPLHLGKRSHVWETVIKNAEGKKVAQAQLTNAILDKTN